MPNLNVALRELNAQFDSLFRDGTTSLEAEVFASSWVCIKGHRDQSLLSLARKCRHEYRASQASADSSAPLELIDFVRPLCDFAFCYLSKRQIVFLMDATSLAFEADVLPQVFVKTIGACAATSPYATKGRIEAAVIGVTGMHRYDAERIATLDALDVPLGAGG